MLGRVAWLTALLAGCASGRYGVAGDSVADYEQGLVWERAPSKPLRLAEAEARCRKKGGAWRLPERDELRALVDSRRLAPTIDPSFPATPAGWFWSATPMEGAPHFVWGVSFEYGGLHYLYRDRRYHARCVRDGAPQRAVAAAPAAAAHALDGAVVWRERQPAFVVLRVRPDDGKIPNYAPGQTITLGLPARARRAENAAPEHYPADAGALLRRRYTITSVPTERSYVEVAVRLRPDGQLSPRLYALETGARLWISNEIRGPSLPALIGDRHAVVIATGIGVAHYVSLVRSWPCGTARKLVLVHGAFKKEELFFREELERRAQSCAGFTYIPTLVEPQADWDGERGTIETLWARGAVAARSGLTPRPEDTHVSLCATLSLVDTMIGVLQGQGYRPALDGHGTFDWCEAD